jgi:lysophospholipase L1-like esterase
MPTKRAAASLFTLILAIAALSVTSGQPPPAGARWRTAWATSQQGLGTTAISNTTVRLIARATIGGEAVRIRIDNTYGKSPLKIARAVVGIRSRGASLVAGSNRPVRFGGVETATVPPGGSVRSDAVALRLIGRQDLAVSLFVPEESVVPSQHAGAVVTSYLAAAGAGDRTAAESNEPFTATTTAMPWLKSIDVQSTSAAGAIVAFGDSITDGTCTTLDANDRWEDWLSLRLALDDDHRAGKQRYKSVVNEGIGGNTVTREGLQPPPDSTPGLERLERDVLSHEGVTDVIVFMGTNDIRRGASAAQVTSGLSQIVQRIKQRGFKVHGVTIIPRHNVAASGTNTGWDDRKTAIRREVNDWIRTRGSFDGVIDFDRVVRDPANADLIFAPFDCDGIHPNPRGYFEMGKSVSLELFAR